MIKTVFTVFAKEVLDNFRDRRTLASALLMGPLFGPLLFAFVINLSIERSLSDVEKTLQLPVIGAQHAPNLVRYLQSRNMEIVDAPEGREAAIEGVRPALCVALRRRTKYTAPNSSTATSTTRPHPDTATAHRYSPWLGQSALWG